MNEQTDLHHWMNQENEKLSYQRNDLLIVNQDEK